jgi:hypothetical protein
MVKVAVVFSFFSKRHYFSWQIHETQRYFDYIGCSFKFILKVGVEESIVNAPRITHHGSAV